MVFNITNVWGARLGSRAFAGYGPVRGKLGELRSKGFLNFRYEDTLADKVVIKDRPQLDYAPSFSNTIGIHDTLTVNRQFDTVQTDRLRFVDSFLGSTAIYHLALADAFKLTGQTNCAWALTLANTIGIHDALTVAQGVVILDKLRLADNTVPETHYGLVLSDPVYLADAFDAFAGLTLADTVHVHEQLTPLWQLAAAIGDTLHMHDTATPTLITSVIMTEEFDLADQTIPQMIFAGEELHDTIKLSFAFIQPDSGSYTTWAINTRTRAVTEYRDFSFNSYCRMGHQYLGAADDGLYELRGERDDEGGGNRNIIPWITSGLFKLGGSKFTQFKAAYIGMRKQGDYILRMETADGRYYDYALTVSDMITTKVVLGKGLRAAWWKYKLTGIEGADFDLDSIEFVPLVAQRRI